VAITFALMPLVVQMNFCKGRIEPEANLEIKSKGDEGNSAIIQLAVLVLRKLTHKNHIVSARIATAPAGVPDPLCIADASVA
jgi:hypothetical protein